MEDSVLIVIDVQPTFLEPVWRAERVVERTAFMVRCANLLGVPVLATEQYPERMGGTAAPVLAAFEPGVIPLAKTAFSCWGDESFVKLFDRLKKPQAVLVGIETHICVCQTAHDLLDEDLDVIVCADAVSARSEDAHLGGLRRMSDEGTAVAHTESVVYEWMRSAGHPAFKEILKAVKEASAGV